MKITSKLIGFVRWTSVICLAVFMASQSGHAEGGANTLAARVASLRLGMEGYTIGSELSAAQKELAEKNRVENAYKGTVKFRDSDLFVVVAESDNTVLALYRSQENAGFDQARMMIAGLMGMFGEPTTMAHDKQIYWAFDKLGKIPEERYHQLRESKEPIEILATVKFNSSFPITDEEQSLGEAETVYFMISSEPLLKEFIVKQ